MQKLGIKIVEKDIDIEDDNENMFSEDNSDPLQDMLTRFVINLGQKRFGIQLQFGDICNQIKKKPKAFSYEGFDKGLKLANQHFKNIGKDIEKVILENLLIYLKNNLKTTSKISVTEKNPLFPRYFSQMSNKVYAANNGVVEGTKPTENFIESPNFYYLKR